VLRSSLWPLVFFSFVNVKPGLSDRKGEMVSLINFTVLSNDLIITYILQYMTGILWRKKITVMAAVLVRSNMSGLCWRNHQSKRLAVTSEIMGSDTKICGDKSRIKGLDRYLRVHGELYASCWYRLLQ
jgi:hypothetical protein